MKAIIKYLTQSIVIIMAILASCNDHTVKTVTIPFTLDHNRMIIEAEVLLKDGTWHKARLWVDSGNPNFFIGRELAAILGIELKDTLLDQEIKPPEGVRIGGLKLDFDSIRSFIYPQDKWLFNTLQIDGNLPSTVLQRYHIIFDYPSGMLTLAQPGVLEPAGVPSPAFVNKATGIIQMDAVIDGQNYSFALDNGSSFSYTTDSIIQKLSALHPEWPESRGAVGCANIWGWWPGEETWEMIRVPEIRWGNLIFTEPALAGLPPIFRGRTDVGTNYSRKTARPVNGFLGPNIFKNYRVEIIYTDSTIYFEKAADPDSTEMDLVGLTVRVLDDRRWEIAGVAARDGRLLVNGVSKGDILLQIGNMETTGLTMGRVVDALRGHPGDLKVLKLERDGQIITVEARVEHIL